MSIALITGASSGLGRAFARRLSHDPAIHEIWAVARRADRLEELNTLCACPVRPIPLDLGKEDSYRALRALLVEADPDIAVLICAAGFGKMGDSTAPGWAGGAGCWRSARCRPSARCRG